MHNPTVYIPETRVHSEKGSTGECRAISTQTPADLGEGTFCISFAFSVAIIGTLNVNSARLNRQSNWNKSQAKTKRKSSICCSYSDSNSQSYSIWIEVDWLPGTEWSNFVSLAFPKFDKRPGAKCCIYNIYINIYISLNKTLCIKVGGERSKVASSFVNFL